MIYNSCNIMNEMQISLTIPIINNQIFDIKSLEYMYYHFYLKNHIENPESKFSSLLN